MYSPWLRNWLAYVNNNLDCLKEAQGPNPNDKSILLQGSKFAELFNVPVPESVTGFECSDRDNMTKFWPAGTDAARQVRSTVASLPRAEFRFSACCEAGPPKIPDYESPERPDRRSVSLVRWCREAIKISKMGNTMN